MIAPLRGRHRWLASSSFGAAAVLLGLAVLARPSAFVRASHALDRAAPPPPQGAERTTPLAGRPRMSFFEGESHLTLVAEERIEAADVLAYGTSARLWEGDLPPDALLLGPVASLGSTRLPMASIGGSGSIVLYSLGEGRVVRTIDADDVLEGVR